jgi:hypothetical protein
MPLPWRKVDLSSETREPAPFVVGVTRSGTTLLRLMLDAHPALVIPPETHFIPKVIQKAKEEKASVKRVHRAITDDRRWNDFELDSGELERRLKRLDPLDATAALRCFYDLYAEHHNKPRWGDKTPGYNIRMRRIARALPEARFIHVIRDGRDVVLSQWSKASDPTPVEDAAKRWKQRVRVARAQASKQPDLYLEVHFEKLIEDPERELRRICDFTRLDFDPAMLSYHEGAEARLREIAKDLPAKGAGELDAESRMAAHEMAKRPPSRERVAVWRNEMEPSDIAAFEEAAGDMLTELGYPLAKAAPAAD